MLKTLLVANRGEIAIRVLRAAAELGLRTVAIHADDDAGSLHTRKADERPGWGRRARPGTWTSTGCWRSPPMPGSTRSIRATGSWRRAPTFAARCAEAGITFVGPSPELLALFGDKAAARALAQRVGVPVLAGRRGASTSNTPSSSWPVLGPGGAVMLKATAGGGGRGSRVVTSLDALPGLFERCRSEAASAFGDGTLFAEELMSRARHVEVQILGDGAIVSHLWERECIDPAPPPEAHRDRSGAEPRPAGA